MSDGEKVEELEREKSSDEPEVAEVSGGKDLLGLNPSLFTGGEDPGLDAMMAPFQVFNWKIVDKAIVGLCDVDGKQSRGFVYRPSELVSVMEGFMANIRTLRTTMQQCWSDGSRCPDILVSSYVVNAAALEKVGMAMIDILNLSKTIRGRLTHKEVIREASSGLEFFVRLRRKERAEAMKNRRVKKK